MPEPRCPVDCLLHDHGDGAYPLAIVLRDLFTMAGKAIPDNADLVAQVRKKFQDPHADIIEAFSNTTGVLQTWDALFLAAHNHVVVRASQGIRYAEVMFAPQYHGFQGLTPKRAVEAIIAGIKSGEQKCPDIEVNFLAAIGRELSPEQAIELIKVFEECDRNYLVGIDWVCDEAAFPPERHIKSVRYAHDAGFPVDFHASEWVRGPHDTPDFWRDLPQLVQNLNIAMRVMRCKRIGHGIALPYAPTLMRYALINQIGITGCPGSNLQGQNVPDLEALQITQMLDSGILWSMNPDDDFFQPDINEVYQACDRVYCFTAEQRMRMRLNAWKTRFGKRKPVPNDIAPLI